RTGHLTNTIEGEQYGCETISQDRSDSRRRCRRDGPRLDRHTQQRGSARRSGSRSDNDHRRCHRVCRPSEVREVRREGRDTGRRRLRTETLTSITRPRPHHTVESGPSVVSSDYDCDMKLSWWQWVIIAIVAGGVSWLLIVHNSSTDLSARI